MKRLSLFFHKLFNFTTKHHRFIFTFFIALIVCSLSQLSKIPLKLKIYDLNDPSFPSTIDYQNMKKLFSNHDSFMLFVTKENNQPFLQKDFCLIKKWSIKERMTNHSLDSIVSSISLKRPIYHNEEFSYSPFIKIDCQKENENNLVDFTHLKESSWKGIFTPSDHTNDFTIMFKFRNDSLFPFHPKEIGNIFKKFKNYTTSHNLKLNFYLGGRTAFEWYFERIIKEDFILNILIMITLIILLRFFFGTWRSGIYLGISLISSIIMLLGVMSLLNWPIDMLSNSLFLMICVAGLQDFIFLSQQMLTEHKTFKNHFRQLMAPCFFTSLTTIIGFASLAFADLPTISRFGILAAIGASIEWLTTFIFLPSLLLTLKLKKTWVKKRKNFIIKSMMRLNQFIPSPFLVKCSIALFLCSLSSIFILKVDARPDENFPKNHLMTKTYSYLKKSRDWEKIVYLQMKNEVPKEKRQQIINEILKDDNIAFIDSAEKKIKDIHKTIPKDVASMALREMETFGTFDSYYSKKRSFPTLPFGYTRMAIYLKSVHLQKTNKTLNYVEDICEKKECFPVGKINIYAKYTTKVVQTLWKSLSLTLASIVLILLWLGIKFSDQKIKSLLFSMIWGPVIMLGICAILDIPINLITAIFITILVGMTGDNAIHFVFSSQKSNAHTGTAKKGVASILVATVSSLTCLGFLFLSYVPIKTMGTLLATGLLLSLVGDLFILKGLSHQKFKH